jgi:hypothetical protein
LGLKLKCLGLKALEMMKGFRGFGSLSMWFGGSSIPNLSQSFGCVSFECWKGWNPWKWGLQKKMGFWIFAYAYIGNSFCCRFLVVGFICLLFKFHGISETFQNLGLERVCHSSLFVRVLCGALLHNYVGGYVVIIKVEGLSHMCVFWNHKQGLWMWI